MLIIQCDVAALGGGHVVHGHVVRAVLVSMAAAVADGFGSRGRVHFFTVGGEDLHRAGLVAPDSQAVADGGLDAVPQDAVLFRLLVAYLPFSPFERFHVGHLLADLVVHELFGGFGNPSRHVVEAHVKVVACVEHGLAVFHFELEARAAYGAGLHGQQGDELERGGPLLQFRHVHLVFVVVQPIIVLGDTVASQRRF